MLSSVGLKFEMIPSDVTEKLLLGESPAQYVQRLASEKAGAIAEHNPDAWVLGADTIVVVDDEVLEKPSDFADAVRMVSKIQGRTHQVLGGFCIINLSEGKSLTQTVDTSVSIAALTQAEIEAYVRAGESMDKAGAYAAQGIGAALISGIQGSYSNVVGLALSECLWALKGEGIIQVMDANR